MKALAFLLCSALAATDPELGVVHGFFLGFIEGLQKTPGQSSPCMQQFTEAVATYELVRLPSDVVDIGNSLIRLRNFLNEATLLDQVCGFRDMASRIEASVAGDGLEEVIVNIIANVGLLKQTWKNLGVALVNRITYDIGWNLAKLTSTLFNYHA